MKHMAFFFSLILSISLFSQSLKSEQTVDRQIATAIEAYELCLKHENKGVIESTIANVLRFKHLHPDANWENIEILLDELSETSNSSKIQAKASLVLQIMKNPTLASRIEKKFYQDVEQFFKILAIGSSLHQTNVELFSEIVLEIDQP
jgi:hypothetical protein